MVTPVTRDSADQAQTAPAEPFETFFESERPRLFATLALVLGDRSEAEEISQEALVRVWERWDRVRVHPDPAGYLFRTAMNLVRQRHRRLGVAIRARAAVPQEHDAFTSIDARRDVVDALRALSPRQRAALVLTELMDLDATEAGALLHIRPATVRSLCSQGREKIRQMAGETR
jgi:RNA polymerase sigma-70 factor (ECF subfamily)